MMIKTIHFICTYMYSSIVCVYITKHCMMHVSLHPCSYHKHSSSLLTVWHTSLSTRYFMIHSFMSVALVFCNAKLKTWQLYNTQFRIIWIYLLFHTSSSFWVSVVDTINFCLNINTSYIPRFYVLTTCLLLQGSLFLCLCPFLCFSLL